MSWKKSLLKYNGFNNTGLQLKEKIKSPNELYYATIVDDVGKWFHYSTEATRLSKAPGFDELMCVKKGDCVVSAYLGVNILRSLGIPSTIDYIPHWGSKNGGHAMEVFLDTNGKMRTASGRELKGAAKVFRLTFKRQNVWKNSMAPIIKNQPFELKHLQNNHWLDVTHEHTTTTTVVCDLPDSVNTNFAYLCVNNYGEWKPVFWGKIKNHKAIFYNMGYPMLYRLAIPEKEGYKVIGDIFMINRLQKKTFHFPSPAKRISMTLQKVNSGQSSWVKKHENYSLYLLGKDNKWGLFETGYCSKDSILRFKNVPSGAFYHLFRGRYNNSVNRIFTYENGKQIWW